MSSQIFILSLLKVVFDRANKKGKKLGITSEQQVYDAIDGK